MPSDLGYTTRRDRFLYRRRKYLDRYFRWYLKSWHRHQTGGHPRAIRQYRKWEKIRGPKIKQGLASANTYNAVGVVPPFLFPWIFVGPIGPMMPPQVKITHGGYLAQVADGKHSRIALVGYHRRGVKTMKKRPRDPRNTALNRRITGCNWFFFHNSCFPDGDVLGRHPNETDIANGAPFATTQWPVPLGYT